MPDYKEGKIYAIRSPNTDKYYIGSTTQRLHKRFHAHKKEKNTTTSKLVLECGDAYIELLELCSCNSKDELSKREGELIREHKDKIVNKNRVIITTEEFKEYQTKYHQEHKERLAIEMKKYREENKERNLKRREENREKANEYAKKYREERKKTNI